MDADSKTKRLAFFFDGTNLTKGLKELYSIERLDIEKYCQFLAQQRQISGIYYAEAPYITNQGSNNCKRQQEYLNYIRNIKGLIYRKGKYSTWTRPPIEKLTDVYLAVEMVDLCLRDTFDIAFLFSGDSDLCPAVDILVREGKLPIIAYFDTAKRNAYALRKHGGGYFINITRATAEKFKWLTEEEKLIENAKLTINKEPGPCDPGGTTTK